MKSYLYVLVNHKAISQTESVAHLQSYSHRTSSVLVDWQAG